MAARTQNFLVARLSRCHAAARDRRLSMREEQAFAVSDNETTAACDTAVGWARQWIAIRSTPTLELDIVDASAWVAAMRAREALPRRARRTAPLPPDPALRTQRRVIPEPSIDETNDNDAHGDIDSRSVQRSVDVDSLRSCAPFAGGAVDVSMVIDRNGAVLSASSSVRSATTDCISRVLRQTRVIGSDGGNATVRGVVLFGPGIRPPRSTTD